MTEECYLILGYHSFRTPIVCGISSFAYLKQIPVDFVKIDGTFIKDILHDPTDLALIKAINQVGHVMGIQTIAKYVQDIAVLQML